MNVATIKPVDIANGEGVRVSLFVSGCTHHCPGCFNAEAWDFSYGEPYTAETEDRLIEMLRPSYIRGLSLLGGEPFEPQNQRVLVGLLRRLKAELPEKDVWCYSGYTLDGELLTESRARCEVTDEMLSMIDVLVDGRFEQDKRNLMLRFRGSENQRLIDLPASLARGEIVEWKGL
ncbi:MAG: anaerobic ribonucleoside-triphosphate reductase activating protein [Clostridia bacterium]|nr:anaerobic ribonucleoside-triphosphate reductase activating protein [Clostridia bacterium]